MKERKGARKSPNYRSRFYRCEAVHRITRCNRPDSSLCIIAIHGGGIEPGTTEIAREIARAEFSFYSFVGTKKGENWDFHRKSENFTEPIGLALVKANAGVVSIHGLKDKDHPFDIYVGGLDQFLKNRLIEALSAARFSVTEDTTKEHPGLCARNVCNRGSSGRGVQLEIAKRLRKRLFLDLNRRKGREKTHPLFAHLVRTIRTVLLK
jgi:phage replication-related protein YjqB (UPF0714/DUF867 family)